MVIIDASYVFFFQAADGIRVRNVTGVQTCALPSSPPPNDAAPLPLGGVWQEPLLAVDRVRFVGEPVAMVITDDAYGGEDAAELVSVDYEPLPAVVGPEAALAGESLLFPDAGSNTALTAASPADPAAFDGCEVVVERTIVNQRVAPVPLEGRATAARWADG